MTNPKRFHIDKRAAEIAAATPDDDELLTTRQTALWLAVSEQWLEIGRHRGYGPEFERLGTKTIRYNRAAVREWLKKRAYKSVREYEKKIGRKARSGGEAA